MKQDESFMEVVENSSTALRIVSNFVGTITDRGVSYQEGEPKKDGGLYPQLTVTFAPNLGFKNVTIGLRGLNWPIHEDGALPFQDSGCDSTTGQAGFTWRLVK